MFKSEAERIIRKVAEETGAEFTEKQIKALGKIIPKIASLIVEEAFLLSDLGPAASLFSLVINPD